MSEALRLEDMSVFAWTDSTVVLAWLRKHTNVWQTFVANRVSEIQASMNATQWRHVAGIDNPADVASRGIMPSELRTHPLWWTGPPWLTLESACWPQPMETDESTGAEEMKKSVISNITQIHASQMFSLVERY